MSPTQLARTKLIPASESTNKDLLFDSPLAIFGEKKIATPLLDVKGSL